MCAILVAIVLVMSMVCNFNIFSNQQNDIHTNDFIKNLYSANPAEIDTQHFYYNQLSEFEKVLYNRLVENKENFIENSEFVWFDKGEMRDANVVDWRFTTNKVLKAYWLDEPLSTMWLQFYKITPTDTKYVMGIADGKNCYGAFDSPEETRAGLLCVETNARLIVNNLSGSDEEKLQQIYKAVSSEAFYAYDEYFENGKPATANSAWGVLGDSYVKVSVCEGFANAYKYVADLAGLKVIQVFGWNNEDGYANEFKLAKNNQNMIESILGFGLVLEENHAWNYVWTEETGWTLCDITWEDHRATEVENGYETSYNYFMVDIVADREDGKHVPHTNFINP